ncbi:MAG: DUF58 domain-containing protein [Clostridiales bacterium]|jgi:hypothetical protein|nr:DUF58 domain-containing protein [Clostridiales bacterium]
MVVVMLQNKLRYLAIIIITGLLAILYNEYFMGILFLTVMILPFLLFAILSYIYGKLSYELISLAHVVSKGDNIPLSIQIKNPTILPILNICITMSYFNTFSNQNKSYKQEFYVTVDKRSTTAITCNLLSEHTGNLKISITKVRVFDYLKLFSLRKRNPSEIKVAVLPFYYELTEDYLENSSKMQVESDNYSTVKGGDDPSEVFAIREYREGDRPARIHWKLSIKQNQLMIKDFSDPTNCSVVVLADLGIPKDYEILEAVDSILECALSLSYSFLLKGQIHYFTWYDKNFGSCRRVRVVNEKDLFEAVDGLLSCGPYTEDVDMAAAYFAEYPNDQYTGLFMVTKTVTHDRLDSLILIKAVDRQILYINGADYTLARSELEANWETPIDRELIRKITDTGMGLFSINAYNMKTDLEELRLSWK